MNSVRACVEVLHAGGSPAQWCRGLERVTAEVAAIDVYVQATSAAAGAVPSLVDRPLLGTTLAELTDCPPGAEGDDLQRVDHPGRLDRSTPRSAPPPRPPAVPEPPHHRRGRRMAADCPSPAPRVAAGERPASRVSTDRLRNWVGDLPAATGVRRSPPKPSPGEGVPGKPRPETTAVPRPESDRPSPDLSSPDLSSGEKFLHAVTAAVWRRVGDTENPPLDRMLKQVTRPGPTAPAELLRRTASGERDQPGSAGRRHVAPPNQGSRPVARRGDAEEPWPTRRREVAVREPTARGRVPEASPGKAVGVDHPIPASGAGFDERAVRTVSRFAEQPALPRRDRVGPPAPDTGPGPMLPGAPRPTSSAASTMSADDLERLIERVLGDAARRHGIEV